MQPPRASLQGLPTELRLKIFEYVFDRTVAQHMPSWIKVYNEAWLDRRSFNRRLVPKATDARMLRVSRLFYHEASTVLHSYTEVSIFVAGTDQPSNLFDFMQPPRASLMGLPPELRLRIYEYIFHPSKLGRYNYFRATIALNNRAWLDRTMWSRIRASAILSASRQLHHEASTFLFSKSDIGMHVNRGDTSLSAAYALLGNARDVRMWQFMRSVTLSIDLHDTPNGAFETTLERVHELQTLMQRAEHLKKILVWFSSRDGWRDKTLGRLERLCEAFEGFKIDGGTRLKFEETCDRHSAVAHEELAAMFQLDTMADLQVLLKRVRQQ